MRRAAQTSEKARNGVLDDFVLPRGMTDTTEQRHMRTREEMRGERKGGERGTAVGRLHG